VEAQPVVRYAFWILWFLILPIAFAVGIVVVCTSTPELGALAQGIRNQRVPSGIALFTLAEMTLYYFRHYLPYADPIGSNLPADLSRDQRREFEAASGLHDEGTRLLERHERAIERDVKAADRKRIVSALERLKSVLDARPFDPKALHAAYDSAAALVDQHLAPWRKSTAREYAESIGFALLVAIALRAFVVEAFKIPSGSMLPTLQIDDHIFVNKFAYGPTVPLIGLRLAENMPPARGDVIVFEFPDPDPAHQGQDFIKRVIALPGDVLEADRGHPVINGWPVPSCSVGKYPFGPNDGNAAPYGDLFVEFLGEHAYLTVYEHGALSGQEGPFRVGSGEIYVMGDNRHNSHDSRRWRNGQGAGVPFDNIRGRAMNVWLPLSRLGVPVGGEPVLPSRVPQELKDSLARCLDNPPAVTTPPDRPPNAK
jgi:signal peptidase I